jgi:two-component system, OmpR family, sensor kinase
MKISVPRLEVPHMPRLGLASFRQRLVVRSVFVLLIAALLALAVVLLQEEKERSYRSYSQGFRKTQAEVLAQLRHPAGQLALLNPDVRPEPSKPLRPLLLPYAALDFDDYSKAQQAVELSGCSTRFPDDSAICVGIGNNPYSGGFIYLVGSLATSPLVGRERGRLELDGVHRARVTLTMRGETSQWIAPFESQSEPDSLTLKGRLTGFVASPGDAALSLQQDTRPVRDFRGWLWQTGACVQGVGTPPEGTTPTSTPPACVRTAFFSVRLPVEAFREALFPKGRAVQWPPPDLDRIRVRFEMMTPGGDKPVFDSSAPGAVMPLSLGELAQSLLPGERITIRSLASANAPTVVLKGSSTPEEPSSPWLSQLIKKLPVQQVVTPLSSRDTIRTAVGNYEVQLTGDVRAIEQGLSVVATRLSWFVGGMLAAIVAAWLVIEVGLIRRIALLTKRAAAVSYNARDPAVEQRLSGLNLSDLRGSDELGILAGGLDDLLQRVKDDVQREHIRAQQERDMWNAVGHEIMSPLQSLMAIHPQPTDASHRYVQRMQQAVRVLYGTASPSEALQAADLTVGTIDLNAFLKTVAANAHFAGISQVTFWAWDMPVTVRADEFSLEDVVTHILRNANRFRTADTPITLKLSATETTASVTIHNQGPAIEPARLSQIFEYGVSEPTDTPGNHEHRGQGLFVAKTYMAKMAGTVSASNTENGVCFTLTLQRLS